MCVKFTNMAGAQITHPGKPWGGHPCSTGWTTSYTTLTVTHDMPVYYVGLTTHWRWRKL